MRVEEAKRKRQQVDAVEEINYNWCYSEPKVKMSKGDLVE